MQDKKIEFWIDEAVRLYFEGYDAKEAIGKAKNMQRHNKQKKHEIKRG